MINMYVADLMFNYDHENAMVYETLNGKKALAGFNDTTVRQNAENLVGCIEGLGGSVEHTVDEIVEDFYRRYGVGPTDLADVA